MSRIYIAYTGGTIGMKKNASGNWEPAPKALTKFINKNSQIRNVCLENKIIPKINEYPELIDSSKVSPENWQQIITDIGNNYDHYDGFVIIHGTDTMAYTSSILSFFFENVNKPIVLTGAQRSVFSDDYSDGIRNILNSFKVASGIGGIREVCLLFDSAIIRGCRATKVSAIQDHAFTSPGSKLLGIIRGREIQTYKQRFVSKPIQKFYSRNLKLNIDSDVFVIKLFPAFNPNILRQLVAIPGIKGVVIEAYGQGNAPDSKEFESALRLLQTNEISVVVTSQPIHGKVTLTYETSAAFRKTGGISGDEMTTESAVAKLYYLFNLDIDYKDIKSYFDKSLRGERSDGKYFPPLLIGHIDETSLNTLLKGDETKPKDKFDWIRNLNSRLTEAISSGLVFEAIYIIHILINDRLNSVCNSLNEKFKDDDTVIKKIHFIILKRDSHLEQVFGVRNWDEKMNYPNDVGLWQPILDWYENSFNFINNSLADPLKVKASNSELNSAELEKIALEGKKIQNSLSSIIRKWKKRLIA
nr:asparaginase [uncultured Allomuricauda sp.]